VDFHIKHTTIKLNQHFFGILNLWIVLPTKYMKLNVPWKKKHDFTVLFSNEIMSSFSSVLDYEELAIARVHENGVFGEAERSDDCLTPKWRRF